MLYLNVEHLERCRQTLDTLGLMPQFLEDIAQLAATLDSKLGKSANA